MHEREAPTIGERAFSEFLTIRELVEAGGLELTLVGGARGQDRRIEAVYIGDLDDPTPWMVSGSLLLTTGPTIETDPEAGPRLVRLLKENDMVGVGVAITPHVTQIPQAMIDAADEVGFPVLSVPPDVPFRAISGYVYNALTSRDMHRLRRSLSLQNRLLQVLLTEGGVEGLVARLGGLLGGDTLLFDNRGGVLCEWHSSGGAGKATATRVWKAYRDVTFGDRPRSVVDVGEWRVRFREARVDGAVERVLVTVQPLETVVSEFEEATLTYAVRLIELELNTTRNVAGVRRRTRGGLLEMLVLGRGSSMELRERLLHHGILPGQAWRILAIDIRPARGTGSSAHVGEPFVEEHLAAVDTLFEERGQPFLSLPLDGLTIVLAPEEGERATEYRATLAEIAELLAARLRGMTVSIGASEPLDNVDSAPLGLAHARQALAEAEQGTQPGGNVAGYEDLGMRAVALDHLSDELLEKLRDRVLSRLTEIDGDEGTDLVHTLERYLAHSCSIAQAADDLYVHRNTMRKRIARIESELGLDLGRVDDIVEAYLGVQAAETLRARRGG